MLNISGVTDVHSGANDCILERKLFERLSTDKLFFIDRHLYKFNKNYIVPVSYLRNSDLLSFANISLPYLQSEAIKIYEFLLPRKILNKIKKFPTNITGIALENGINAALHVEMQDNREFLFKNKSYLKYIGSLESKMTEIPIEEQDDGTLKSLSNSFNDYIEDVNVVTKMIVENLCPVFDFIRREIFTESSIIGQELVISDDGKVLALCDLSNEENILEIKTYRVFAGIESIDKPLIRQLYYESKGRKKFVLTLEFIEHHNKKGKSIIDNVKVVIYKVDIKEIER